MAIIIAVIFSIPAILGIEAMADIIWIPAEAGIQKKAWLVKRIISRKVPS